MDHPTARVETPSVIVEIMTQRHPTPTNDIFQENMHILALQQSRRQDVSQGRYCLPDYREGFRDIGRMMAVPASVPLEIRASGGPVEIVRCRFNDDILASYGASDALANPHVLANCINLRHSFMADTLARLSLELRAPSLASTALVEAMGTMLIIEFARYLVDHPKQAPVHRGGLSRRQYRMITEYVQAQEACPSLSDLSELTGLSIRHLTRAFRQTTGETVYSYIEQVRFEKAQALLVDSDLLMKDIARRLGFACSSSFSVAFRKIAGETPLEFRRRLRPRSVSGARVH